MGLISWQLVFIILISYNSALRSIGPDVALDLYIKMRVRRLLLVGPYMDFPVQEITSNTLFAIVQIILDFSHALLNWMCGFDQLSIVKVILTKNICWCTRMTDFASVRMKKGVLMEMDKYLPLHTGSTAPLNIYLGGKVSKVFFGGIKAYVFSLSQYVQ